MKSKSKKQPLKKKSEFRYHAVFITNKKGKIIKIKHPTYVFLEKGNIFIYITITHSQNVDNAEVVQLRSNPNPKDKKAAYRVKTFKKDKKDQFGKRRKGWKMNENDKKDVWKEYKEAKEKPHF